MPCKDHAVKLKKMNLQFKKNILSADFLKDTLRFSMRLTGEAEESLGPGHHEDGDHDDDDEDDDDDGNDGSGASLCNKKLLSQICITKTDKVLCKS